MTFDPVLSDQLKALLAKAERSIKAAEELLNKGFFDFASSRAYYAAFYALEALLLSEGKTFSKHQGLIAAFRKHFIKTGIFPINFSEKIGRLFRNRQWCDYDPVCNITAEDAREDIHYATEILQEINKHIQAKCGT